MTIRKETFATTPEGVAVERFTIENGKGVSIQVMTYGAILLSCKTPGKEGRPEEITLGFNSLERYLERHPFFGATVGRFANRIARGTFVLDGKSYQLAVNDGPNHLHGGVKGFDKQIWQAEGFGNPEDAGVVFRRKSPAGEESYPGNLQVEVTYSLNEESELILDYVATTDRATPINLTNHSYWNLGGASNGSILGHQLSIAAERYLPVDETSIPTGEIARVEGTPMDFRSPKEVGRDIDKVAGGYDHCFVLGAAGSAAARPSGADGNEMTGVLRPAATVVHGGSGRRMEVSTTMPGVQLYTGNKLEGVKGTGGRVFHKHDALCLETEYFPDAVNRPAFLSCILRPGQTYRHRTVYKFGTT